MMWQGVSSCGYTLGCLSRAAYPEHMVSTYLTKRRAVDHCHCATALCRPR
jgi:hypothetical protein